MPRLVSLLPAVLIVLLLFGGGLLLGVLQSFGLWAPGGEGELSLSAYRSVFSRPAFLASLVLTLGVSVAATAGAVALGVAFALVLRESRRRSLLLLFQLPLTVPYLVAAIGMLFLLRESGLLARVAFHAGVIDSAAGFPRLVFDRHGVGIALVYLWKQTPFIGLIVLSLLEAGGDEYEAVARSHGATSWQTFRHVMVPHLLPSLIPGSIIIFAYTFGSFEVPLLLGRPFPSMLAVLAYREYVDVDLSMRAEAMALGVTITLLVIGLAAAYRWALRWGYRGRLSNG
ncbi:MAG: ABC transporter permease [Spirochaetota bacterium]